MLEYLLEHVSIVYFFRFSVVYLSGEAGVPILSSNDILVHGVTPALTSDLLLWLDNALEASHLSRLL